MLRPTRGTQAGSVGSVCPTANTAQPVYFSLLARRRYSPTVMAFFWMLYCVKRPDWPVTTCWMGAGITTSSMSSYVCRGFHSFGGMICKTRRVVRGLFLGSAAWDQAPDGERLGH